MIFDLILQSHPIVFINYIQFGFELQKMAEELQKNTKTPPSRLQAYSTPFMNSKNSAKKKSVLQTAELQTNYYETRTCLYQANVSLWMCLKK